MIDGLEKSGSRGTVANAERILVPIDIRRCPVELFDVLNGFARRPEVTLILLHVVALNIVPPETRIYDELAGEARTYLERLVRECLDPNVSTLIRVRRGKPAEEIRAEAKATNSSLIILPTYGPSFWKRLTFLWKPSSKPMVSNLVEKVSSDRDFSLCVVSVKTRFDCEQTWGRPAKPRTDTCAGFTLPYSGNRSPEGTMR